MTGSGCCLTFRTSDPVDTTWAETSAMIPINNSTVSLSSATSTQAQATPFGSNANVLCSGDAPEHSSPVAPCQSQPACDPPIASQDILYFDLPGGEPSTRPVCQTRPQSASLTSCLCFSRSGTSLTYSGAYQGLCVGCHSF